jgi:pimeloyl-ACP methyl ester carboxylesterase
MNSIGFIFIAIFLMVMGLWPLIRHSEHMDTAAIDPINAPGKFIRLSRGRTHYEIAGPVTGPVVVFVHGFSVPFYMWDHNFYALARSGFRVIRYDIYGRGLSERPDTIYNRDLFVEQLAELLDALEIHQPVTLAGNSMGGAVSAAFTASYPERVEKVILVAPLIEKRAIGPLRIPIIGEYLTAAFLVPSLPRAQLRDFYRPEDFPEWPRLFREQMQYRGFGRALLSTLRNFFRQDHTTDYERINQEEKPVLLIWGAADRTLGTHGAGKLRRILKPEFLWIGKAGHIPQYECPEIVNHRIIDFLSNGSRADLWRKEA